MYPGVGWIVWRDADAVPGELIFWVNYLGDDMPTFALNFSRPGAQVVAQYYNEKRPRSFTSRALWLVRQLGLKQSSCGRCEPSR